MLLHRRLKGEIYEGFLEVLILLEPGSGDIETNDLVLQLPNRLGAGTSASVRVRPSYIEADVVEAAFRLGGLAAAEKILWGRP